MGSMICSTWSIMGTGQSRSVALDYAGVNLIMMGHSPLYS